MGIFDEMSNPAKKIVDNEVKLAKITSGLQEIGSHIVVTIGSWDVLHIGHMRYLIKAKSFGDILVVGVDTDRAIKLYKGPNRPVVPENERLEMLSYQSCIDLITTIDDVDDKGRWRYALIKTVRPDAFIAVEDSYPPEQQEEIKQYCGKLVVLPRQAEETSTSHLIQQMVKKDLLQKIKSLEREEEE